jgi:hypothetical protein
MTIPLRCVLDTNVCIKQFIADSHEIAFPPRFLSESR